MDIVRARKPASLFKKVLAGGVGAAVVVGIVVSLVRTSSASAPALDRSATWTERVKRGDFVRQVPVQGALVPEHVRWLSAETAARVARIAVRPGAHVEPDTVVLVLENTDLELAAIEAERQAASAEARLIEIDARGAADESQQATALAAIRVDLRDADRHAQTAKRLGHEGLVGDNEARDAVEHVTGLSERLETEDLRRQTLVTGNARQRAAQHGEIERIREIAAFRRRQLAALEVRAGIAGTVQELPLENGQWVAIGTLLAKVAEPSRLKAELKVAEGNAKDVRRGLAVRFENAPYSGRIERVDPAVVGGAVRIEVALDDPSPAGARVDEAVTGFVEIEKIPNALHVARPAGVRDGSTVALFRLDPDHASASRVPVRIGRSSTREVEILDGLAEGDEIVVSDISAMEASSRIRLK